MKPSLFCLLINYYFVHANGGWLEPREDGDLSLDLHLSDQALPPDMEGDDRPLLFPSTTEHIPLPGPGNRYKEELKAGAISDLFASNRHYSYSHLYDNLGRRHQHSTKGKNAHSQQDIVNDLLPKKATPDFVIAVAKKSQKERIAEGYTPQEVVPKAALRSGDYWNSFYVEEVDPEKQPLRIANRGFKSEGTQPLNTIRASVSPGSEYYELISILTRISPKLVYVVNKE